MLLSFINKRPSLNNELVALGQLTFVLSLKSIKKNPDMFSENQWRFCKK